MEAVQAFLESPDPLPMFGVGIVLALSAVGALKIMPLLPWLGEDDEDDEEISAITGDEKRSEEKVDTVSLEGRVNVVGGDLAGVDELSEPDEDS